MTSNSDTRVTTSFAQRVQSYCEKLQERICNALEEIDGGKKFGSDEWSRPEGGGGLSRVMEDGGVFEKAGVNTSAVYGTMTEKTAERMGIQPCDFLATGISLVIHPRNPMVPTVHANYRYFENSRGDSWFGGGSDLTPYYLFEDDVLNFHATLKNACDVHDRAFYPKFKAWCDEYFYIKHRGEARGVGGVFFDYLRGESEKYFSLIQSLGDGFLESYAPIVKRRMTEIYGERERGWQLHRRGRYAEFNLVYDRGTTFGLETNGRVESILMSLPPLVRWPYNVEAVSGSREANLVEILKHPKEWVSRIE